MVVFHFVVVILGSIRNATVYASVESRENHILTYLYILLSNTASINAFCKMITVSLPSTEEYSRLSSQI